MRSAADQRQARAGAGPGVPEGRRDDRDGPPGANGDRHPAGRDRLTNARQHRPLRARPPIPGGLAGDEPATRANANSCNGPGSRPTGSSGTPMTWSPRTRNPRAGRAAAQSSPGALRRSGLRKAEKTAITHIDEGFVFLGQRSSAGRRDTSATSTPSSATRRGLDQTQGQGPDRTLHAQHRAGRAVARSTRSCGLGEPLPARRGQTHVRLPRLLRLVRVVGWLRKKHPQLSWKQIRRRYSGKDRLQENGIALYNPGQHGVDALPLPRSADPQPWTRRPPTRVACATGAPATGPPASSNESSRRWHDQRTTPCVRGEPDAVEVASPVRRAAARKPPAARPNPAPRRRPQHLPLEGPGRRTCSSR